MNSYLINQDLEITIFLQLVVGFVIFYRMFPDFIFFIFSSGWSHNIYFDSGCFNHWWVDVDGCSCSFWFFWFLSWLIVHSLRFDNNFFYGNWRCGRNVTVVDFPAAVYLRTHTARHWQTGFCEPVLAASASAATSSGPPAAAADCPYYDHQKET